MYRGVKIIQYIILVIIASIVKVNIGLIGDIIHHFSYQVMLGCWECECSQICECLWMDGLLGYIFMTYMNKLNQIEIMMRGDYFLPYGG